MDLIKRAKTITGLGITSIIFDIVCTILLLTSVIAPMIMARDMLEEYNVYLSLGMVAFGIVVLVIAVILSWVGSLLVLATNWNDRKLDSDRILWGLLSIFLLGPIAVIIFGVQAKGRVRDNTQVILEPETVIQA